MRTILAFYLISLTHTAIYAQFSISGNLVLDSSWNKEIYLSLIPGLGSMFKSSEQMIIGKASINDNGDFHLEANLFPDKAHLVRLHLSKKNDPPATLIIGGRDENHCFLGLSNKSRLSLRPAKDGLFDHFSVEDDETNQALLWVDSMVEYFSDLDKEFNSLSHKNMVRTKQTETLLHFADSIQHILPALYAIYHADMGNNKLEILNAQRALYERLGSHPYLDPIEALVSNEQRNFSFWPFLLLLAIVMAGFYWVKNKKPTTLKLLSKQEKKVLNYLVDGKSNKEIASQMNIEPTTVKSHVYNIYSKLKISSRKEVGTFKKWVKGK